MKKDSTSSRPKRKVGEEKGELTSNIHHVRRKIEDILLEREQKKLLEL